MGGEEVGGWMGGWVVVVGWVGRKRKELGRPCGSLTHPPTHPQTTWPAATLQQVTVPYLTDATCKSIYNNSQILPGMLCAGDLAGGKDSCQVSRRVVGRRVMGGRWGARAACLGARTAARWQVGGGGWTACRCFLSGTHDSAPTLPYCSSPSPHAGRLWRPAADSWHLRQAHR